jgi:hypothetical protein
MFHHLMFPDSCVQSLHCQMPIRNEYIYICHDMAFARAFTFALGLGLGMAFAFGDESATALSEILKASAQGTPFFQALAAA